MRALSLLTLFMAAPLLHLAAASAEEPFHNGGTGSCQGCHTDPPALIGSDASSTCLICHQAPAGVTLPSRWYVASDPSAFSVCVQLPPAGDFCWLRKSYRWDPSDGSGAQASSGERHGHNIVALDLGFEPDSTHRTAPGGSYPSSALSCISCHDPHGTYRRLADGTIATSGAPVVSSGSYPDSPDPSSTAAVGTFRMLAGKGYRPTTLAGVTEFQADPPAAVAPTPYNRAETSTDTRVAYGSGMSEWCGNCHAGIQGSHTHPSGRGAVLSAEVVSNYNAYLYSGNLTGRSEASYTSLVPYEMGTSDYAVLKRFATSDNSMRSGPVAGANVMCLTCHRVHASGWDSILRWNVHAAFLVYDGRYPGTDAGVPAAYAQGRLAAETQKTFYDRPPSLFAPFQRSLCSKCHSRD